MGKQKKYKKAGNNQEMQDEEETRKEMDRKIHIQKGTYRKTTQEL